MTDLTKNELMDLIVAKNTQTNNLMLGSAFVYGAVAYFIASNINSSDREVQELLRHACEAFNLDIASFKNRKAA